MRVKRKEIQCMIKKKYNIKGTVYKTMLTDSIDCAGQCDPDKKLIYIHSKMNKENKEMTLYHELGHALFAEIGVIQTSINSDMQEIIVENFSHLIFDLLKR